MQTPVEIQLACLDKPSVLAEVIDLISEYAQDPLGRGKGLDAGERARVAEALPTLTQARVFLARRGSTPVGVAVCFLGFSTFSGWPLLNIHDLCVSQSQRAQGVGRLLLQAVERYATSVGCRKLTLEVREDNPRARGLYQSEGFGELEPPMGFWHKPIAPG